MSVIYAIFSTITSFGAGVIISLGIVSIPELPPDVIHQPIKVEVVEQKEIFAPQVIPVKTPPAKKSPPIKESPPKVTPIIPPPIIKSEPIEPTPEPTPIIPPVETPELSQWANQFKFSYTETSATTTFIAEGFRDSMAVRGWFTWEKRVRATGTVIKSARLNATFLPADETSTINPVKFTSSVHKDILIGDNSTFPVGYYDFFVTFHYERGSASSEAEWQFNVKN